MPRFVQSSPLWPPQALPVRVNDRSPQARGITAAWPIFPSTGTSRLWEYVGGDHAGQVGTVAWEPSLRGPVVALGGSGHFQVAATPRLSITSNLTVSVWAKTSDTADNRILYGGYQNSGSFPGLGIGFNVVSNTGKFGYWFGNLSTGWLVSAATVTDGVLHHLAVVVNGTSVSFYIDGKLDVTRAGNVPNTYTGVRCLGTTSDGSSSFRFNGSFSGLHLYNVALTVNEVAALAANPWGLYRPERRGRLSSLASPYYYQRYVLARRTA